MKTSNKTILYRIQNCMITNSMMVKYTHVTIVNGLLLLFDIISTSKIALGLTQNKLPVSQLDKSIHNGNFPFICKRKHQFTLLRSAFENSDSVSIDSDRSSINDVKRTYYSWLSCFHVGFKKSKYIQSFFFQI